MRKIKSIMVLDGYNIINAWDELKKLAENDLEYTRDRLNFYMSEMANYTGNKMILVYDAYRVKNNTPKREVQQFGKLEVVYTKEKETADSYIERYITSLGNKKYLDLTVVTDDLAEQQVVIGKGASCISTRQLYIEMSNMQNKINKKITHKEVKKRTRIEDVIDKDILEKLIQISDENEKKNQEELVKKEALKPKNNKNPKAGLNKKSKSNTKPETKKNSKAKANSSKNSNKKRKSNGSSNNQKTEKKKKSGKYLNNLPVKNIPKKKKKSKNK